MAKKDNTPKKPLTKVVKNRGTGKIELVIDGVVWVFPVGKSVIVPVNVEIPNGIGLFVK